MGFYPLLSPLLIHRHPSIASWSELSEVRHACRGPLRLLSFNPYIHPTILIDPSCRSLYRMLGVLALIYLNEVDPISRFLSLLISPLWSIDQVQSGLCFVLGCHSCQPLWTLVSLPQWRPFRLSIRWALLFLIVLPLQKPCSFWLGVWCQTPMDPLLVSLPSLHKW